MPSILGERKATSIERDYDNSKDTEFNPEEFETRLTESLDADITDFLLQAEIDKQKEEIKAKVAEKIKNKYFKNGLPNKLPYSIRDFLCPAEDKCIETPASMHSVHLSDEDITKLQSKIKEFQTRQNEIIELILDKEKYISDDHKNLIGSYVSEYKKIEGIKSNYLDRLQAGYCNSSVGDFNNHFCEPNSGYCDCNARF